MSRKSFAVGTGAMALSPLVDIVGRDQGSFSHSALTDFLIGKRVIEHTLACGARRLNLPPAHPR